MAERKVTFITDASPAEIRRVLNGISGHGYHTTEEIKKSKSKMSEARQIVIIWGSVLFSFLALFLFIEWGTRP